MNQNQQVLNHLAKYGSITPRQALERYGIMRLGARIYDLRDLGYRIDRVMEKGKNRYGKPCTYARYFLRKDA